MSRRTLLFPSLSAAALYTQQAGCHFMINTCNFTITGQLSEDNIKTALSNYGAILLANSDSAYSYDPVLISTRAKDKLS